jgi:HTH-type transcriptional regulator/antitoxin MqsA
VYPKKCGECGSRVEESAESIAIDLRGETVDVHGIEHGRCTACGEVYLDIGAAGQLQREAVARLREARGLLTPAEIRDLRTSLDLSQAKFEKLLGTGPKTVVRWEKGTVFQSATADRLMRLLIAQPALADLLSAAESQTTSASSSGANVRSLAARPQAKARRRRQAG